MRLVAAALVTAGLLVGIAPEATAGPLCVHRGVGHIEKHGGKIADDQWHLGHGEPVTCDDNDNRDDPRHDAPEPERYDAARHNDD
jgi:hypothetical protein